MINPRIILCVTSSLHDLNKCMFLLLPCPSLGNFILTSPNLSLMANYILNKDNINWKFGHMIKVILVTNTPWSESWNLSFQALGELIQKIYWGKKFGFRLAYPMEAVSFEESEKTHR